MKSAALDRHFATLYEQRRQHFPQLLGLAPSVAWRRPDDGAWSVGEWLEHIWRVIRIQCMATQLLVPLGYPFALLFRGRPYETEVTNVFETRPDSIPGPSLPCWKPKHGMSNPLALQRLAERLDAEAMSLRKAVDIDEGTAGHIRYWDGPFGWVNVIQSIQIVGFHEANDFRHISDVVRKLQS